MSFSKGVISKTANEVLKILSAVTELKGTPERSTTPLTGFLINRGVRTLELEYLPQDHSIRKRFVENSELIGILISQELFGEKANFFVFNNSKPDSKEAEFVSVPLFGIALYRLLKYGSYNTLPEGKADILKADLTIGGRLGNKDHDEELLFTIVCKAPFLMNTTVLKEYYKHMSEKPMLKIMSDISYMPESYIQLALESFSMRERCLVAE